jgi:hypothetical protein
MDHAKMSHDSDGLVRSCSGDPLAHGVLIPFLIVRA